MPEIDIDLNLGPRSGSLASAISTLRQAGLEFLSHQLTAAAEGSGKRLTLKAFGELPEPARLGSDLESLRGVEAVERISLDGRPVAGVLADEPPPEAESPAAEAAPEETLEPEDLPPPEAEDSTAEALVEPEPEPEPEPQPQPELAEVAGDASEADTDPAMAADEIRALASRLGPRDESGDGPDSEDIQAQAAEAATASGTMSMDGDEPRRDTDYLRRRSRYKRQ